MSVRTLRYHPDRWAHDLGEWWRPLARTARATERGSDDWLLVLGVEEFFERPLLGQPAVLGPWLCLAAAAVAAACVRHAAEVGSAGTDRGARLRAATTAAVAFDLALTLQQRRWAHAAVVGGRTTSTQLMEAGRAALRQRGLDVASADGTDAVALVAGWLAVSGEPATPLAEASSADQDEQIDVTATPGALIGRIAGRAARRWPMSEAALVWGTAHLVERLARGILDDPADADRPDEPPTVAWANVLLVSGRGEMGLFEARRQRSALDVPAELAIPDLARLAFIRPNEGFVASVSDSLLAARRVNDRDRPLERDGELITWSLQLAVDRHPLAERGITGRSAGLGAYVAFRSLASPGTFAARDVAFTGQVSTDGAVGKVQGAQWKIQAAARHRIRMVVHPANQPWRDPTITVELEPVKWAEDALVAASKQLHDLRSYLEAACHLVAPEPWMRTWLERRGRSDSDLPLLDVTCRQITDAAGDGGTAADGALFSGEVAVRPCAAHLLADLHPNLSFAVTASAGAGSTVAAKRMVAVAARRALDELRAARPTSRPAGFVLPLYLPLWEQPGNWDHVLHVSMDAIPGIGRLRPDAAAAIASALRDDAGRGWRALVVADGTDRIGQPFLPGGQDSQDGQDGQDGQRDLVALLAGSAGQDGATWQPRLPAQIVLFGRIGSPAHQQAVHSLRRLRPGAVAEMQINPLSDKQIERFVAAVGGGMPSLAERNHELAANPLLLALSVIAGPSRGDFGAIDLFDRGLDVLLGERRDQRAVLAELAYRAAASKGLPAGVFGIRDIAAQGTLPAVQTALQAGDTDRALAYALDPKERCVLTSVQRDTHLLTTTRRGWRFFHDRLFAFLVADRIALRATARGPADGRSDDDLFGALAGHLGDPQWADVIEATGRLIELAGPSAGPA